MQLFMLSFHDASQRALRELARDEIDHVFGGDSGGKYIGGEDDCPDSTTCETVIITPNADGDFTVDCDAG